MRSLGLKSLGRAGASLWGVLAILVVWQVGVWVTGVNSIVLPGPLAILADIRDNPGLYLGNTVETVLLAVAGLVGGMALGTGLAVLCWASGVLAGLFTPLGVVFASVPVVALIPILARVFGYDRRTVLAVVVIICFFPAFVFTGAGLRALPPGSADLFRVLGAPKARRLRLLALPAALPDWSVALRLAAANSILAAMVAEFLMGTSGLGYLFSAARSEFDMARALGASAIATVVSVSAFAVTSVLEARIRRGWK